MIKSQQAIADRFARLGLIPKPINVSEIVWKWTPGSFLNHEENASENALI